MKILQWRYKNGDLSNIGAAFIFNCFILLIYVLFHFLRKMRKKRGFVWKETQYGRPTVILL